MVSYRRTSIPLRVRGADAVLHAIPTGTVTIKRSHDEGVWPERVPYPVRFATIVADRRFAEPKPVWAFAIEHPTGVVVVDTGTAPSYNDDDTWQGLGPANRMIHSFIRLTTSPEGALPEQLAALGVDASTDVSDVVLTHQHVDHTEAVPAFTQATLWTTAAEDAIADRIGSFPTRWRPREDRIAHVDREGHPAELGTTVEVAPGIEAIHTPGHTPGSVTVRIDADGREILLTGDTSFTAEGMDPCARTAGIHVDLVAVRRLQSRLASRGAVLLPAHDPENADRLEALATG